MHRHPAIPLEICRKVLKFFTERAANLRITVPAPVAAARYAVLYASLFLCGVAWAQTSGSISLLSDYLFRGMSLSDGNPVVQANAGYDSPDGWYAGALATPVSIRNSAATAQVIGYGGYAHPLQNGWSWEAGATETVYAREGDDNYAEFFVGLSSEHAEGRIYYSPNYLGQDVRTVYTELNATYPLFETPTASVAQIRLLGHVGYLHVPPMPYSPTASRFDTRVGIGATIGNWDFQLAWVAVEHSRTTYTGYGDPDPRTGVASASYSF